MSEDNAVSAATLRLMTAAKQNDASGVRAALADGADADFNYGAPLRHAAGEGHGDIALALLDAGADVHMLADAALRAAVAAGHLRMATLLLDRGADPDANDGEALVDAVEAQLDDIAALLIERGANVRVSGGHVLRQAAGDGNGPMVSLLLEAGADPYDVQVDPRALGQGESFRLIGDMLDARRDAMAKLFAQALTAAADLDGFLQEDWAGRGESALAFGVRCGLGARMAAMMEEKGVALTRARLENACDCDGVPLLRVAAEKNVLHEFFRAGLWRGRGGEAVATFEAMPAAWFKTGLVDRHDLSAIITAHRQAALKDKAPARKFRI